MKKYLSLCISLTKRYSFQTNQINGCRGFSLNFTINSKFDKFIMGCRGSKSEVTSKAMTTTKVVSDDDDEYVEGIVCKDTDINENEMKTFELEDAGKVLLVKQKGKLSALGYKCTHYGAPLNTGALGDGRIRCPWHGACFNIGTGDIEDYPGLDSLPCYQVSVENNQVKVRAKRSELSTNKRTKCGATKDSREAQHIVVVGGGPSGATCVETLRQEGFKGAITLVCREPCLPYDRVKVSKAMDFEIQKAQLRSEDFYKQNGIDVLKGVSATALDTENCKLELSNGNSLKYDRLYVATGCKPFKVDICGVDLKNVVVLRDHEDAAYTQAQLTSDKDVVVYGSSFIALEAAAYCVNKVKSVTVIARGPAPFIPVLGERIGKAVMKFFEEKGIVFRMKTTIGRCIGENDAISGVELNDGSILKADLLILGTGSTFYTDFLKSSDIELQPNGAVNVNEYLQTNKQNVYAGGDIAYAPVFAHNNEKIAIGHYPLAHYHGKIAALNMLGKKTLLRTVPFFWTMLFGKGFRYAGYGRPEETVYVGNVEELKFVAFYLQKDEVVAVSSCGMDPVVAQFAELMYQGKKLYKKDVECEEPLAWTKNILPMEM